MLRKSGKQSPKVSVVKLYPNPANDKATLEYNLLQNESGTFNLYNTAGQIVITFNLAGNQGSRTFSTSTLTPAIYTYKLITNGNSVDYGKLVIVR